MPADWNWHVQNTDIAEWHPGFSAVYSGPGSLDNKEELKETVSFDLMLGARLWRQASIHVDALAWQGFGFSNTRGIEAFPNGEAFRLGTRAPDAIISRLFIRQTFGFGGETEKVEDDGLHLPGTQDLSRLTLTAGKFSAKDIFDNNAYANDPRTQFLSWALMANEAWDYPADSLGFTTGFTAELYQPSWTVRYGLFQMPPVSNGMGVDHRLSKAWGMVIEFERRYSAVGHPGALRFLAYENHAHMGSYAETLNDPASNMDITTTRAYRSKIGLGLNAEQELARNIGAFARLGWSDGKNEAWTFADVDSSITAGVSLAGAEWGRQGDVLGLAGGINMISAVHRRFLEAGGSGILAGDGRLSYASENFVEAYYDTPLFRGLRAMVDYQYILHPVYNRDRGPVSALGMRLHWEY